MSNAKYPAPPFDRELKPVLDVVLQSFNSSLHPEDIPALRSGGFTPGVEELIKGRPIEHFERTIPGPEGAPDLLVSVFRRTDHVTPGPGFFFTHVGGLIFGDRFVGIAPIVDYVEQLDAVVVTAEYRLAPENPAPAQVEDSYAALKWTAEHAEELGFAPDKLIAAGMSAGAGLAAAVALKARDNDGPDLAGQLLTYPMLDDRNDTVSSHQIDGIGVWDRTSNFTGWNAALGDRRGTADVSPTSPRAGLPTSPACRPPTSRSAVWTLSVTRAPRTPRRSGRPAVRPNCTSGRAVSTSTSSSPRTRPSRSRPARPAPTGCAARWASERRPCPLATSGGEAQGSSTADLRSDNVPS